MCIKLIPLIAVFLIIDVKSFGEQGLQQASGANQKPFARKIVRPADLENEIRVIKKLCEQPDDNIVQILKHGELPNSLFYFIDMTLCNKSLHDHIQTQAKAGTLPVDLFHQGDQNRLFFHKIVENVIVISVDILRGLEFFHGTLREVHRDLKPQNGIIYSLFLIVVLYCEADNYWK